MAAYEAALELANAALLNRASGPLRAGLLEALSTGQEPRALPVLAEAARVHAALAPQAVMLAVRCGPSTDLSLIHI